MSPVVIAAIIMAVIAALMCYAFVSQTLEKKRQQKQRLLAALKGRTRLFKYILSGLPDGFLTRELSLLVHRCMVETCEQLIQLDSSDGKYLQDLQHFSGLLDEIKRKPKVHKRVKLNNAQQIGEVKKALEELHKFIVQMERRGNISATQSAGFAAQIKKLVLQISVDSYLLNAKQSQQAGKLQLAVHYYTLAKKLLGRENTDGSYTQQIEKLSGVISQLSSELADDVPDYQDSDEQAALKEQASKEWSEFGSDDSWKKKTVYD